MKSKLKYYRCKPIKYIERYTSKNNDVIRCSMSKFKEKRSCWGEEIK